MVVERDGEMVVVDVEMLPDFSFVGWAGDVAIELTGLEQAEFVQLVSNNYRKLLRVYN